MFNLDNLICCIFHSLMLFVWIQKKTSIGSMWLLWENQPANTCASSSVSGRDVSSPMPVISESKKIFCAIRIPKSLRNPFPRRRTKDASILLIIDYFSCYLLFYVLLTDRPHANLMYTCNKKLAGKPGYFVQLEEIGVDQEMVCNSAELLLTSVEQSQFQFQMRKDMQAEFFASCRKRLSDSDDETSVRKKARVEAPRP